MPYDACMNSPSRITKSLPQHLQAWERIYNPNKHTCFIQKMHSLSKHPHCNEQRVCPYDMKILLSIHSNTRKFMRNNLPLSVWLQRTFFYPGLLVVVEQIFNCGRNVIDMRGHSLNLATLTALMFGISFEMICNE